MAPSVFKHANSKSAVYHQPETPEERLRALQALLACPTASIHTERPPKDIKDAHNSFPIAVDAEELPVQIDAFVATDFAAGICCVQSEFLLNPNLTLRASDRSLSLRRFFR